MTLPNHIAMVGKRSLHLLVITVMKKTNKLQNRSGKSWERRCYQRVLHRYKRATAAGELSVNCKRSPVMGKST